MGKDKVLEMLAKIAKLTSKDSGAFQGEISAASAKINELMEKYCITWAEVREEQAKQESKKVEQEIYEARRSGDETHPIKEWQWRLGGLIAHVTHTRCYASVGYRSGVIAFFGTSDAVAAATELYSTWNSELWAMSWTALTEFIAELRKKYPHVKKFGNNMPDPNERTRYFRPSWIDGCISGMWASVKEQEKERNQQATMAIQLYDNALAEKYKEFSKDFRHISTGGSNGYNLNGYSRGKKFGSGVTIGAAGLGSGPKKLSKPK